MWDYRATITAVHDGDTVTMSLDRGFGDIRENMRIRLLGVFAPELTQPGGQETRQFVMDWITRYGGGTGA